MKLSPTAQHDDDLFCCNEWPVMIKVNFNKYKLDLEPFSVVEVCI